MKRIVLIASAITIGMFSCKKEDTLEPATVQKKLLLGGDKKDVGGWDIARTDSLADGGDKKDVGGWDATARKTKAAKTVSTQSTEDGTAEREGGDKKDVGGWD
jgi:hypothetical protein